MDNVSLGTYPFLDPRALTSAPPIAPSSPLSNPKKPLPTAQEVFSVLSVASDKGGEEHLPSSSWQHWNSASLFVLTKLAAANFTRVMIARTFSWSIYPCSIPTPKVNRFFVTIFFLAGAPLLSVFEAWPLCNCGQALVRGRWPFTYTTQLSALCLQIKRNNT